MLGDFWDTRAIARVYIPERGSRWSSEPSRGGLAISDIAIVEMASTFQRRFREEQFSETERDEQYARFLTDSRSFSVVATNSELLARSAALLLGGAFTGRGRALDAVQLAAAIRWFEGASTLNIDGGVFIVADKALREAAIANGMPVENPEDYA